MLGERGISGDRLLKNGEFEVRRPVCWVGMACDELRVISQVVVDAAVGRMLEGVEASFAFKTRV